MREGQRLPSGRPGCRGGSQTHRHGFPDATIKGAGQQHSALILTDITKPVTAAADREVTVLRNGQVSLATAADAFLATARLANANTGF
ncbi:hypothetical protein Aros01_09044 [Streptosporangium roseum]|uniref:Uncharacterized protein n=1 Tax=Streptosporangium roseum (strain ATCC 12428 / DSM 43021 / JCM 3005 / KCTC 9067 / NCIMB 10171 / NRRL 2505 / NI 9100) TaxID=479432 RepID=D2B521_STRRD|nr:hypothetical protein Sros_4697 [Streptosporangium roseum DSM 43021]